MRNKNGDNIIRTKHGFIRQFDSGDRMVIEQIEKNQYKFLDEINAPIRLVVDIGAHIGLITYLLMKKFDGAFMVAIEPIESNYELLKKNGNLTKNKGSLIFGAYSESRAGKGTMINFNNNKSTAWKLSPLGSIDVPIINLHRILVYLSEYDRIDFLKVDIEGSESDLLRHKLLSPNVRNMAIELHGKESEKAFDEFMQTINYSRYFNSGELKVILDIEPKSYEGLFKYRKI